MKSNLFTKFFLVQKCLKNAEIHLCPFREISVSTDRHSGSAMKTNIDKLYIQKGCLVCSIHTVEEFLHQLICDISHSFYCFYLSRLVHLPYFLHTVNQKPMKFHEVCRRQNSNVAKPSTLSWLQNQPQKKKHSEFNSDPYNGLS